MENRKFINQAIAIVFPRQSSLLDISDTCNGWPTTLSHLTTDTSMFPVNYGTSLSVQCKTGYSLTAGDSQITCVKGTSFSWSSKPLCTLGKVCGTK